MLGKRIQQLKEVMATIIDDLKPDDYFNIIQFSTSSSVWRPAMEPQIYPLLATENNLRKAHFYINSLRAHGGTNIYSAIMNGLEITTVAKDKLPDNVEPLILFLTDGEPTVGITNSDRIRKDIKAKNKESVPIYSIAFGKEANFTFLKELSLENNGFGRKIYESGDGAIQIRGFYKEISSPLLSNVTFKYTSQGENEIKKTSKRNFIKAFSGSEIAVAGTFKQSKNITQKYISDFESNTDSTEDYEDSSTTPTFIVEINANGRDGQVLMKSDDVLYTIDVAEPSPSNNSVTIANETLADIQSGHAEENYFLERLWAYLTVKQLLEMHPTEEHLDDYEYILDSNEVVDLDQPTSLPIPELPKSNESSADRALRLSLKYGFVTPVTSLVVVKPDLRNGNTTKEFAKLVKASLTEAVPTTPPPPHMQHRYISTTSHSHSSSSSSRGRPGPGQIPSTILTGGIFNRPPAPPSCSNCRWGASDATVISGTVTNFYFKSKSDTQTTTEKMLPQFKLMSYSQPMSMSESLSMQKQPNIRKNSTGLDLSNIKWLPRTSNSIFVDGKAYTLKKSNLVPVPVQNYRCENKPETSSKVAGNCDHLENCVLNRMTKMKLDYTLYYFCPLENEKGELFAGICCPDDAWI